MVVFGFSLIIEGVRCYDINRLVLKYVWFAIDVRNN